MSAGFAERAWRELEGARAGPRDVGLLAFLIILAVFTTACGTDEERAGAGAAVSGTVLVGSCPVAGPAAPPCETQPVAGVRLVVYDLDGNEVAEGESRGNGTFRISLEPGRYVLVPKEAPPPALPIEKPIEFTVRGGANTRLRVLLDTGVR